VPSGACHGIDVQHRLPVWGMPGQCTCFDYLQDYYTSKSVEGPNLAKGQILANVALCRVCQWQTFVHVQGEGPVRVHVQPLQRRQSTQVRGRQPPLP
jgi:hypothetical protein